MTEQEKLQALMKKYGVTNEIELLAAILDERIIQLELQPVE